MEGEEGHDIERSLALSMLASGPKGMGEIRRRMWETRPGSFNDAYIQTAAGRSKFDATVWRIMSSLCNSGLAESTGVQRFRITERGRDMLRGRKTLRIGAGELEAASEYYRSMASSRDPAGASPPPEEAAIEHEDGIVAVVDMLGTRKLHGRERTGTVHNNWNALVWHGRRLAEGEQGLQGCRITAFSDTMFITAGGDARALLGAFGRMCIRLIPRSIELNIPVRGCVAAGEFYESAGRLFTGPAVNEAAAYHGMPQWIGISCCPSAYSRMGGGGGYTKYDIPLKSSVEYGGLAVNWPDLYNREDADREGDLGAMLERLERGMEEAPGIGASLKWRNTRDFLRAATGTEGSYAGSPAEAGRAER